MEQFKNEIWKDIPGYEGLYQVSNCGRVVNLSTKKTLKGSIRNDGYVVLNLYKNRVKKTFYIHLLVIKNFIINCDDLDVNHIDGNKQNNALSNLEYVTKRENTTHSYRNKKSKLPTGVDRNFNRYRSRLKHRGKFYTLGFFDTPEEAHQAYLQALKSNGLKNKYAS